MNREVEKILQYVQKPGRYSGGELNSVIKDKNNVSLRYAFCFPDVYEIGMSHLGIKILYGVMNNRDDIWCERVFAPWVDMEEQMRKNNVPLFALESGDSVKDFDMIGFTLQYEMCYTNILNMLDLAGLPLKSKDRTSLTPIVVAGGPCACNPEPIADFIDIFSLGDGEESTLELADLMIYHKQKGSSKEEFLRDAAKLEGIYVPAFYNVDYKDDGTIEKVTPLVSEAKERIKKRVITDMDSLYYPDKFVVPSIEVVFDRVTGELFRGCIRGCRFCQAGFVYRPIREKSADTVNEQCKALCRSTGYDEISLASLSTSDYTHLEELLPKIFEWAIPKKINVALPSLRVDNFSDELMEQIQQVRRSGLTFAAEAGTQRLRDAINKNVTEESVLSTSVKAFDGGWTAVKLYFMLGLPTETMEDVEGIAELSQKVVDAFYNNPNRQKGKSVSVNISVASFVPKPFTPFQWEPQDTMEMLKEKQEHLKASIKSKKITASCHEANMSFMEAVLARGDRKLCALFEALHKKGCRFDSWDEFFNLDTWLETFKECGLDPAFYANRRREYDEILPWDIFDFGIRKSFLQKENEKAKRSETTPNCREKCAGCGADSLSGGKCDGRN
ncbi:MAG: TIGR03960 family B12-binding radical SAM protein [Clostridia bacterium]|nr:TIGR03960 family B12-binding radical SAM protein [Clostridia bacterium]